MNNKVLIASMSLAVIIFFAVVVIITDTRSSDGPSPGLAAATHQIYQIDAFRREATNYQEDGFWGLAEQMTRESVLAQAYLEEEVEGSVIAEACDTIQRSSFCEG